MTLSHDETKEMIDLVLKNDKLRARQALFEALSEHGRELPEFYAGVLEHGPGMTYTAEQWFDFLCKIPIRDLYAEPSIMNKLSENQRSRLPKPAFDSAPEPTSTTPEKLRWR